MLITKYLIKMSGKMLNQIQNIFLSGSWKMIGLILSYWLGWISKKSFDRYVNRKKFIETLQAQLDATITPNGPSMNSFQCFGKVAEKLIVHMNNKEKQKWENVTLTLDTHMIRSNQQRSNNDLLKSLNEEYGKLCNNCYEFLYRVTNRLQVKWKIL